MVSFSQTLSLAQPQITLLTKSCLVFYGVLLLLTPLVSSYELLDELSDTVNGGDYKFYTLTPRSITLICLISDKGDADLYVDFTSSTNKPDYLTHKYSATSSGLDVVTILKERQGDTISIGVHGHVAHDNSTFRLYIIQPSPADILEFQIWELDPETNTTKLIIDVDPLWMANDPKLHRMLELLSGNEYTSGNSYWIDLLKQIMWLIIDLLRILLEILA